MSVNDMCMLGPAGLRKVGPSLVLTALFLFVLLGGRPRGAFTGDSRGDFAVGLDDIVGDTTAAAAAIRDSPEVPWKSAVSDPVGLE